MVHMRLLEVEIMKNPRLMITVIKKVMQKMGQQKIEI